MFKYKKLIIVLLMLVFAVTANSQKNGYLGRKFGASIGVRGMPYIGKMWIDENLMDFNIRFSTRIEYVLFKNFSIGLNYERVSDKVELKTYQNSIYLPISYSQLSSNQGLLQEYQSMARFNGHNYGYFMKFYFKKSFLSMAPLGRYFLLGYDWSKVKVFDDGRYFNNVNHTDLVDLNSGTFYFGWGMQNIYYKFLTVDLFMGMGYNKVGFKADNESNELLRIGEKLASDNLFIVKLNIGWMLF